jgi:hypothetical protein
MSLACCLTTYCVAGLMAASLVCRTVMRLCMSLPGVAEVMVPLTGPAWSPAASMMVKRSSLHTHGTYTSH